jgi:3-dehydroquinate synthase
MVAAFRLASRLGRIDASQVERMTRLLGALGLPTEVDAHLAPRTLAFIGADKKRKGGKLRFIVPGAPGATTIEPLTEQEIVQLVMP